MLCCPFTERSGFPCSLSSDVSASMFVSVTNGSELATREGHDLSSTCCLQRLFKGVLDFYD